MLQKSNKSWPTQQNKVDIANLSKNAHRLLFTSLTITIPINITQSMLAETIVLEFVLFHVGWIYLFSKYEKLNIYGALGFIKGHWGQTRGEAMDIDPCTLLSFLLSIDLNKSRVMCVGILGEFFFFLNKKQRTKRCRKRACNVSFVYNHYLHNWMRRLHYKNSV